MSEQAQHNVLKNTSKFIEGDRYYCQVEDDIKELKCINIHAENSMAYFNAGVISLVDGVWVGFNKAKYGAVYKNIDSVSLKLTTKVPSIFIFSCNESKS